MKSREVFALVVRIAGLACLLYLLGTSVLFFGVGMRWFFVVKSIVWLIVSIWLIRGAPQLVRFAYPNPSE